MAKTEDIEAKLAAYIDGEIDAADRAEIEKHLAGNAQHRQLIQELIQQRQLLQGLPREMAPADVAETINAQLERAVLLGDVDGEAEAVHMRIGFWPQIRAVAAVLLLTAGLAAVIYYFLPPAGRGSSQLALMRSTPATAESELGRSTLTLPADKEETSAEEATLKMPVALAAKSAASAGQSPTTQSQSDQQSRLMIALGDEGGPGAFGIGGVGRGPGSPIVSNLMPRSSGPLVYSNEGLIQDQMLREIIKSQPDLGRRLTEGKSVVYVTTSANPDAINREVGRYLTANNIAWETGVETVRQAARAESSNQARQAAQAPAEMGSNSIVVDNQNSNQRQNDVRSNQSQSNQIQQANDDRDNGLSQSANLRQNEAQQDRVSTERRILAHRMTPQQVAGLRGALDGLGVRPVLQTIVAADQLTMGVNMAAVQPQTSNSLTLSDSNSNRNQDMLKGNVDGNSNGQPPPGPWQGRQDGLSLQAANNMTGPTTRPILGGFDLGTMLSLDLPRIEFPGLELKQSNSSPNTAGTASETQTSVTQDVAGNASPGQLFAMQATTRPAVADSELIDVIIVIQPEPSVTPSATQPGQPDPPLPAQ